MAAFFGGFFRWRLFLAKKATEKAAILELGFSGQYRAFLGPFANP
jgi:hypothetical protein